MTRLLQNVEMTSSSTSLNNIFSYIHRRVDFRNSFIVCWKLVYLNTVVDQLSHDLELEFLKFTFGNGVSLCDDGDNVDLDISQKNSHML